jgi:hypothetical protein
MNTLLNTKGGIVLLVIDLAALAFLLRSVLQVMA